MAIQQYKTIAVDCLCDMTAVPTVLLENYRAFNLGEGELVFLLQLLRLKSHGNTLELDLEEGAGEYSQEEIKRLVCALVEKGFISWNGQALDMSPLFDKLKEGWGWRKKRALEDERAQTEPAACGEPDTFGLLYTQFEQEMGRPLSAIESEKLRDWTDTLALSPELIHEALKRAVLNGIYSFSYIDKILNDWHKKCFRTLADVRREDTVHEQKKNKNRTPAGVKVKYRGDQEESPAAEIYEV